MEQTKKYKYWQWRTLIVLMIAYILYYFLRKNFSAALPAMQEELGITKLQLGIFITLNGIIYGLSRFVNGFIADRCSRRKQNPRCLSHCSGSSRSSNRCIQKTQNPRCS